MKYIERAITPVLRKRAENSKCSLVVGAYVKIGLNQEKPYKTRA